MNTSRSRHKNVYLLDIIVGASFQILDVLEYACGLKLRLAAISNKYPIFGDGFCERHKNDRISELETTNN